MNSKSADNPDPPDEGFAVVVYAEDVVVEADEVVDATTADLNGDTVVAVVWVVAVSCASAVEGVVVVAVYSVGGEVGIEAVVTVVMEVKADVTDVVVVILVVRVGGVGVTDVVDVAVIWVDAVPSGCLSTVTFFDVLFSNPSSSTNFNVTT